MTDADLLSVLNRIADSCKANADAVTDARAQLRALTPILEGIAKSLATLSERRDIQARQVHQMREEMEAFWDRLALLYPAMEWKDAKPKPVSQRKVRGDATNNHE